MADGPRLVSVVMACYNAANTISVAIDSVIRQEYPAWELLVVDDGSNDSSVAIVRAYALADGRVKLIELAANTGSPAVVRNAGIKQATGSLIAFLDADDAWLPGKLKTQVADLDLQAAALSCTAYEVRDSQGEIRGSYFPPREVTYAALLRQNALGCSTVVYDVDVLGKRYFPDCGHEDYALWLTILGEGYTATGLRSIQGIYRLSPNSVSSNKLRVIPFFWHIYHRREGFSRVRSLLLTVRYLRVARSRYRVRGT